MPRGHYPRPPASVRFWSKVDRRGDDECWPWTGKCEPSGYGVFIKTWKPYKLWKAHRFSWELHNAPIPEGLCVLHRCDNPPCVNPAHLYVGTRADNARDRAARGRGKEQRGEANPRAKITNAQVAEIRQRVAAGETQTAVAKDYDIRQPQVSRIVRGINR